MRGPAIAAPVEWLLDCEDPETSGDAADLLVLFASARRSEMSLHSQRIRSIIRKKTRGRIEIVPIRACEHYWMSEVCF